eukprot:TRINITY_DN1041_c0_g1_i5.p1 TRINITY_DN1041_c0_g1~~TRINITY_DN1041_c0_g1_i5.p1  ORF type:complete len:639 (-),score=111.95 TRINITY_DN1041_c0_g1_i5:58-1953(-)
MSLQSLLSRINALKAATTSDNGLPKLDSFVCQPSDFERVCVQIRSKTISCLNLHGPPGCGKSSFLQLINRKFCCLSIVFSFFKETSETCVLIDKEELLVLSSHREKAENQLGDLLKKFKLSDYEAILIDDVQLAYYFVLFLTKLKMAADQASVPIVAAGLSSRRNPTSKDYFSERLFLPSLAVLTSEVSAKWPEIKEGERTILLNACAITDTTTHLGYFYRLVKALLDDGKNLSTAFDTVVQCAIMWQTNERFGLNTRAWQTQSGLCVSVLLQAMLRTNLPIDLSELKAQLDLTDQQFEEIVTCAEHVGVVSVANECVQFPCPIVYNMCLMHLANFNNRQALPLFAKDGQVSPSDAASVVLLAASQVNWEEFNSSLPFKRVFHQHVYFPLCHVYATASQPQICTEKQTVIPEMFMGSFVHGARGWVDHWIDDSLRICLEWLVLRSPASLREHLDRFEGDGKYTKANFNAACVVALATEQSANAEVISLAVSWNANLQLHKTVCMLLLLEGNKHNVRIQVPGLSAEVMVTPQKLCTYLPDWTIQNVQSTQVTSGHLLTLGKRGRKVAFTEELATKRRRIEDSAVNIQALAMRIVDSTDPAEKAELKAQQATLEAQLAKLKAQLVELQDELHK